MTSVTSVDANNEDMTLERPEDPVEVEIAWLPGLIGRPVDDLALFIWRDLRFEPLNFQVDERGANGGYFAEADRILDANDQVVFMCEDLGGRADPCCGVDGAESERLELEIRDPLDDSKVGWVYAFTGVGLPRSSADYVEVLEEEPFAISSDRFLERSVPDKPDVLDELRIFPPLGSGENFIDRFKIRTKLGLATPWITEANPTHAVTRREVKDGTVRVIHSYWVSLAGLLDFTHTEHIYYRQLTVIRNDINQIWRPSLRHIAMMMDRTPEASDPVVFFDNRGGGLESVATFSDVVDGRGPHAQGGDATFAEWVSPRYGGTLTIQDNSGVPLASGGSINTYYCDDAQCEEDLWPRTGDGENWGQYGIWLQKVRAERFQVEAWNPRIAASDTSRGGEFVRRYFHRPQIMVEAQVWDECPCGTGIADGAPATVPPRPSLRCVGSNPFNPHTAFSIGLVRDLADGRLVVYDASGRQVRQLHRGPWSAGEHRVQWDGRNDLGLELASGVYTAQLTVPGEPILRRRVILLK